MTTLKLFAATVVVFLAMDALWLGVLMKGFYSAELGDLARRENGGLAPRWAPAILVYVLIPLGIVLFVRPAAGPSPVSAAAWGAVYGFIGYGIYDLTNRAVLERWSLRMTLVDLAWGSALCGFCAFVMRLVESKLASK
jgi:uncharacterized membrane protein